jgi:hypothetical protein
MRDDIEPIQFRGGFGDVLSSARREREAMSVAPTEDFDAYESLAFWLGMRDEPSTLGMDSPIVRFVHRLLKLEPKRGLANPRLEGIRRLTVALRHKLGKAGREVEDARLNGVPQLRIDALRRHFDAQHR